MAHATSYGSASRVEDSTRSTVNKMADAASDLANKAGNQVDKALDSAEAAARSVAEHGKEAGERVTAVAGNMKSAVDKSLRDQPMTTLAVAAALGFVVGALWKS